MPLSSWLPRSSLESISTHCTKHQSTQGHVQGTTSANANYQTAELLICKCVRFDGWLWIIFEHTLTHIHTHRHISSVLTIKNKERMHFFIWLKQHQPKPSLSAIAQLWNGQMKWTVSFFEEEEEGCNSITDTHSHSPSKSNLPQAVFHCVQEWICPQNRVDPLDKVKHSVRSLWPPITSSEAHTLAHTLNHSLYLCFVLFPLTCV